MLFFSKFVFLGETPCIQRRFVQIIMKTRLPFLVEVAAIDGITISLQDTLLSFRLRNVSDFSRISNLRECRQQTWREKEEKKKRNTSRMKTTNASGRQHPAPPIVFRLRFVFLQSSFLAKNAGWTKISHPRDSLRPRGDVFSDPNNFPSWCVVMTRPAVPGTRYVETEARKKRIPRDISRRGNIGFRTLLFCENGAFPFRARRMWMCAARTYAARAFLFLLRLHRYKPSMMDDRSTNADFAGHGGNEELAKNTAVLFHARSSIHNEKPRRFLCI